SPQERQMPSALWFTHQHDNLMAKKRPEPLFLFVNAREAERFPEPIQTACQRLGLAPDMATQRSPVLFHSLIARVRLSSTRSPLSVTTTSTAWPSPERVRAVAMRNALAGRPISISRARLVRT